MIHPWTGVAPPLKYGILMLGTVSQQWQCSQSGVNQSTMGDRMEFPMECCCYRKRGIGASELRGIQMWFPRTRAMDGN